MSGSHVTGSKVIELLSCTNGVAETGFTWSPWDQAAAFSSPRAKAEASICSLVKLCPLPSLPLPPCSSVFAAFFFVLVA